MKLNRHLSIVIGFLILVSNMGLAFNVHYCHGEVSSIALAYKVSEPCNDHHKEDKKSCCAAAGESHKKCCDNDLVKLEDKSDNIIVKSFQLDLAAFCEFNEWKPVQFYDEAPAVKKQFSSFYCEANAPPLFKLYCQYIFYA